MLTLEDEDLIRDLRRELIVLVHVSAEQYPRFTEDGIARTLQGLDAVKAELVAVNREQAGLKIAIPPLLPSPRLREVLTPLLARALGTSPALSIRLIPELADTVEAARDLLRDWGEETGALCYTDEAAVGDPLRSLSELKALLREAQQSDLERAFPLNHYDSLCLWRGAFDGIVWGPEAFIARVYGEMVGHPVSTTARSVEGMGDLLEQFQRPPARS